MRQASDKNQVQVIARAAHILRALDGEDAGLSLSQIAARVNLARSTVQRIVASLEAEKLLIAASPTGRVRLGPAILRLASSVRGDFVARARPYLIKLSDELREERVAVIPGSAFGDSGRGFIRASYTASHAASHAGPLAATRASSAAADRRGAGDGQALSQELHMKRRSIPAA